MSPNPVQQDHAKPRRLLDFLTFERSLGREVTLLIYWSGLGLIAMLGFGLTGIAVGVALRGEGWEVLLAIPAFVIGALLVAALLLLWRGMSEFYVAVFRIADELKALREALNADPPPELD